MRWLFGFDSRRRKAFISLVVFLKKAVLTVKTMYAKLRGRKYMVEEYS